jgi:anti-sigma factor RsiW
MSSQSPHTDHPVDDLPDFVRGSTAHAATIESHLAGCATCRSEVALLRTLAETVGEGVSAIESERVYREFERRRREDRLPSRRAGSRWMSVTWKLAAGFAMLLTSVGVWRVVQSGSASGWDPEVAVQGFAQDLADIELSVGDLRLALGVGLVDDPALDPGWDMLETDVPEIGVPWENDR